jgi:hypothetical protein
MRDDKEAARGLPFTGSSRRSYKIALVIGCLLVFAAAIASIRFATSQPRAQRPPFIMFGLGSLAVTLASDHPIVAAIRGSRRPV